MPGSQAWVAEGREGCSPADTPGLFRWVSSEESICRCKRCRRHEFNPWVRKIPWRRIWQPTPVFSPGKFHEQRSLEGYSLWGRKESDTTEQRSRHTHSHPMRPLHVQSSYEASPRALSSRDALEMPSQVISRFPKCMSQDKEPGTKVKRDSTSQCNCKILLSSRGTRVEIGPISWGRRGAAVARLWKGL